MKGDPQQGSDEPDTISSQKLELEFNQQGKSDDQMKSDESRPGSPRPQNMEPGFAEPSPAIPVKEDRSRSSSSSLKSRPGSPRPQSEVLRRKNQSYPTSTESLLSHPGSARDAADHRLTTAIPKESLERTPEADERWDSKSIMESKLSSSRSADNAYEAEFGEPPHDRCWIVWLIIMLHGIGVLIPWNMFITIAPQYYVDYWFTMQDGNKTTYAKSFMNALGITSQLPNFLMGMLNLAQIVGGSLMLRISGTLFINCVNVAVIIALVVLQDPSEEAMTWFYYVTLTIVVILNGSNGLYQNSVFGLTADFPAAYTNAIVVGNNICGTFISILSIATNLAFITDSKSVALTYFSITLAVLIVCILSLFYLTQVEFYKYYVNKGKQARIAEHATRPSLRQFCETFKGCWMQLLSVFLVFFVTLAVFPAVLAGTTPNRKGEPWNSDIPKDIYLGLTVFLNFNLLAAIGSTTANFVQIPGPNYILFPVLLRLLFIPYFMLCNYNVDDRVMPVLFENQWFFIIGNAIMAFTSGYFSSLAMMYAPRVVHSSLSKTAGMAAAAILVTGVFCGVSFVPAITYMVNNIYIEDGTLKLTRSA
uniref:Equilibrative nucleoside transporter domain containing protein n=2 Tax=Haemonchus contortus TaxID=6289 RepID=A0A7I4YSZ4_HAECO